MFKKALITAIGLLAMLPALSQAAIVTFTDRTAFEAYINGGVVDDLLGIPSDNDLDGIRPGYSWTMADYGCAIGGCSDMSSQGMSYDDDYVWTYTDGSFDFNSTIYAFGIDFGSYNSVYNGIEAQITLNGFASDLTLTGGFFGIASTDGIGLMSVFYGKNTQFGLFDNVTWATLPVDAQQVSEPASLGLIGLGLIGFGLARRKRT